MPDDRVRLFVALELPEVVRGALIDWRDGAATRLAGLRALAAESLHVTLCFLGWQGVGEVDAIVTACGELSGQLAPRLSVAGARWLPPRQPRVLAVELADSTGALARTQTRLSELLQAGGWYRPEKRPYLAHVTVARVARGSRVKRGHMPEAPSLSFDASTVTLYRSQLMRSGAVYEPLARVELG